MILIFSTRVSFYCDYNVVKMYFILEYGYWMVGYDITGGGWMQSEEAGLLTPPRTGWLYAVNEGWTSDDILQLIF